MDYVGKGEMLTNTDSNKFANKIWEKSPYIIVYIEKLLDYLFQQNKSDVFIFLFSVKNKAFLVWFLSVFGSWMTSALHVTVCLSATGCPKISLS